MNINDVYSSDLLKAADLKNMEHTVVIATVDLKTYDDGRKFFLTFQHRKKGLVLNKTNARRLEMFYGEESDNWIGREIVLYPDITNTKNGTSVPCIRVRAPLARPPAQQAPAPAPVRQVSVAAGQVVQERDGYQLSTGNAAPHPNAPGVELEDTF